MPIIVIWHLHSPCKIQFGILLVFAFLCRNMYIYKTFSHIDFFARQCYAQYMNMIHESPATKSLSHVNLDSRFLLFLLIILVDKHI